MADTAGACVAVTPVLNRGCGWPVAARGGTQPHIAASRGVLTVYVAAARSGQGRVSWGFYPRGLNGAHYLRSGGR